MIELPDEFQLYPLGFHSRDICNFYFSRQHQLLHLSLSEAYYSQSLLCLTRADNCKSNFQGIRNLTEQMSECLWYIEDHRCYSLRIYNLYLTHFCHFYLQIAIDNLHLPVKRLKELFFLPCLVLVT